MALKRRRTPGPTFGALAICAAVTLLAPTLGVGQSDGLPLAPEDGGPRRWTVAPGAMVDLYAEPAKTSRILASVNESAILSNLGCIAGAEEAWCNVRAIAGGPRGYVLAEHLRPAMGPDGTVPTGPNDSARRAKMRDFDGFGEAPCAQIEGEAMGTCTIAVARSGGGDATVVATFSNSFSRTLYFVHGMFTSANATMSGVGTDTDWSLEDGLHRVRVEGQRYELNDALIFGP